ncbi:MAG TPA: helix-turn-helix transcriptional regulator [Puia sp.]|nr:helix-turn-helix transcriptional regulator [Puia sp.]
MIVQPEIRLPDSSIISHVNEIQLYEDKNASEETVLSFFADGYPGIMFQFTTDGLFVSPQNKQLPVFFLYGQTIHPIELSMKGPYRLIAFQLFPDSVRQLFEIQPKEINDGCFDLSSLTNGDPKGSITEIQKTNDVNLQIRLITDFLVRLSGKIKGSAENKIRQAIHQILKSNGQVTIKEIRDSLFVTERTFERQFISQVGIGPKQFAKIIRFQNSLSEITDQDLDKLTDVVYNNGFADQSHFIKTFREFTGKTPGEFRDR